MIEASIPVIRRGDSLARGTEPAVVLLDKPGGITSFAVVRRVRRLVGVKKVGHAGTLDPMATGLLIVLIGRGATRCQDEFMALRKVYSGTIRLGQTTLSFDAETEVAEERDASHITDAQIELAIGEFLGEIEQLPPMYSAVKIGGERLYKKARRGEEVERLRRTVEIYRFQIIARRGDDVDFEIECSKGTYVRALAHDLGQVLGVGAHLTALRREAIGEYHARDSWQLEDLEAAVGGMAEDGGQKIEGGGQKAEGGGQKAEDGGQKAESGGQKMEEGGRSNR